MKIYTLNTKSYYRHLWPLILFGLVMPIGIHFLMMAKMGGYTLKTALIVGVIFFIIFILPVIILHINHYLVSKGRSLKYDKNEELFIYNNGVEDVQFRLNDIKTIKCYKSWPMTENRTPIFSWDLYNYTLIELKNDCLIKISSLLVYEFDKKLQLDDIELKKTLYAWIS